MKILVIRENDQVGWDLGQQGAESVHDVTDYVFNGTKDSPKPGHLCV